MTGEYTDKRRRVFGPICYKPRCSRPAVVVDQFGWKWCANHMHHADGPVREIPQEQKRRPTS